MEHSLHAKYGLKRVINASGRMSILGVSTPTETVMEAMKYGGRNFVEMADFVDKSGDYIAQKLGAEAALIVNSASSGIALSVAALVTQGDRRKSERLHQDPIEKNEIIIPKGHNVNYGAPVETMIYLGGGKVVEAGYANECTCEHLESAIGERTAAILYVKSHHTVQKNMLSETEAWEIAQRRNVPLIIDAAAEESLRKYVELSDLVIFSGSKAIEGPTSGIVCGKRAYIDWLKVQLSGIGRSMKVGKEAMFGLLKALDEYVGDMDERSNKESVQKTQLEQERLQSLLALNEIAGIRIAIVQDEAGRAIYRGRIHVNSQSCRVTAEQMAAQLRNGEVAIYTRDYGVKQGFFDVDPRSLRDADMEMIVARIREIAGESK